VTLNKLGNYTVECSQPISHTQFFGVIKHFGLETTADEVIEALQARQEQNGIKAERIMKGKRNNRIPTLCMKLMFPTAAIPEYVYFINQRFKVNPFVDAPYQCYNCQGFRHGAKDCKGKSKCVRCAGEHKLVDCPHTQNAAVKCANCGQNHAASYGGCKRMKLEKKVEQTRAHQGVTYREALTIMKNQTAEVTEEFMTADENEDNVAATTAQRQKLKPQRVYGNTPTVTDPETTSTQGSQQ
jgi:hypothetical protein